MRWNTFLNVSQDRFEEDSCEPDERLLAQLVTVRLALIQWRTANLDLDDWQKLLDWLGILPEEYDEPQSPSTAYRPLLQQWLDEQAQWLDGNDTIACSLTQTCERIAALLQLDDVERDLMTLIWLKQRHRPLQPIFLAIDASQSSKFLSLLLPHSANTIHQALQEDSRLVSLGIVSHTRARLIDLDDILNTGPLLEQLAPLIHEVNTLGSASLDSILHQRLMQLCPQMPSGQYPLASFSQVPLRQMLIDYLSRAMRQGQCGANVLIYGQPGVGKTELVKTLATQLGATLYGVPVDEKDHQPIEPHKRLGRFRVVQKLLTGRRDVLLMFDEIEDVLNDIPALPKGWTNQLLEENPVPSVWLSNSVNWLDPAFLRRFDLVIEIKANAGERAQQQHSRLMASLPILPAARDALAAQPWMTSAMASQLNRLAPLLDPKAPLRNQQHVNQVIQGRLKAQGLSITQTNEERPEASGGKTGPMPAYDMAWLNTQPGLDHILARLTRRQRGRLCLHGLPGSGKTAMAAHLAKQMGRKLITAHASSLMDKFVGGTEQKIADVFAQARENNAVLLLDEVDTLLMTRDDAQQSWEVSQTNELLVQLDNFDGIVLATTNRVDSLDRAVMRRFDLKVGFLPLQPEQLRSLLQQVLPSRDHARLAAIPNKHLAQRQVTPGNVRTALDQLDLRGLPIRLNQLLEALTLEEQEQHGKRQPIGFIG